MNFETKMQVVVELANNAKAAVHLWNMHYGD